MLDPGLGGILGLGFKGDCRGPVRHVHGKVVAITCKLVQLNLCLGP